ncbi:MAG TPA: hypothetical protein VHO48_11665, partial [Anaerolineaceae bacterium]|nr:hypothetical protein [Anaerolineaceae bacterium]
FPRMHKEAGEKRVFLPEFIQKMTELGLHVFVEEGYGSRSGFTFSDYHQANDMVHMCTREEAFQQEVVIVLRSPRPEEFDLIPAGACLISMLHYPTRPERVKRLQKGKIKSLSLDSIINDINLRLVENMRAVAWNGLEAAFDTLEQRFPNLCMPDGEPILVTVLGTGMVGKHAVDAGTKLGRVDRNNQHILDGGCGSMVLSIGRNLTLNPAVMQRVFRDTDVLVDATQRRDTSQPVAPNAWLGWLPEHAVVVDLAVDPYNLECDPPVVRGIEGIPQGDLDQYVFAPDDPLWDEQVPPSIPSACRRTTVSCYSWPGIHPEACMRHYAQQLQPLMETLIEVGYDNLSPTGTYFERALYRATLDGFLRAQLG